uniref:Uncharacterized protein n=1 Tax=Anguilla anguilla TaxID=7936 RepID=A0A0E9SCF9_ANGAN
MWHLTSLRYIEMLDRCCIKWLFCFIAKCFSNCTLSIFLTQV